MMKNDYIGMILNNKRAPFDTMFSVHPETKRVKAKKNVLVYDLETTGIDPVSDDITQVSYIIYSPELEEIERVNTYVQLKTKRFESIDLEIVKKTKISKEKLENGIPVEQAISTFLKKADNCIVVSFNGWGFDDKFITTKTWYYLSAPFWPMLFASNIDLWILSTSVLYNKPQRMSLKAISEYLNTGFDESLAHNALYDVQMTARLLPPIMRILAGGDKEITKCAYRYQKSAYRYWRFDRFDEPWEATEKQINFAASLLRKSLGNAGMKKPLEWLLLSIFDEETVLKVINNKDNSIANDLTKSSASELINFLLWFERLGVDFRRNTRL